MSDLMMGEKTAVVVTVIIRAHSLPQKI